MKRIALAGLAAVVCLTLPVAAVRAQAHVSLLKGAESKGIREKL
jgi:hypothetical protein